MRSYSGLALGLVGGGMAGAAGALAAAGAATAAPPSSAQARA
jgi:hypothetical protein